MDRSEKAQTYFDTNFNCAQSVLTAFAEEYGLSVEEAFRIATAFGGGIGRQQLTCGAVTGAAMALGLKFDSAKSDYDGHKKMTYERTVQLFDAFTQLNGSVTCRKLLNDLDMNDEKDYQAIMEQNLFHTNCRKYVADAVKITEQIIHDSE